MTAPEWSMNIQRSCTVLYFHFFWGLALIILGWTTFAARWIPRIKPYHRRMGQVWVYGMIVQIYSSTYASYNGFRWFIFMFGVICYGSLIAGHSFIRKFQTKALEQRKPDVVTKYDTEPRDGSKHTTSDSNSSSNSNGQEPEHNNVISMQQMDVANNNESDESESKKSWFTQRRLKQIHGTFMFISLVMLTGAGAAFTRRFASTMECKNIYCDADAHGEVPQCMSVPA